MASQPLPSWSSLIGDHKVCRHRHHVENRGSALSNALTPPPYGAVLKKGGVANPIMI